MNVCFEKQKILINSPWFGVFAKIRGGDAIKSKNVEWGCRYRFFGKIRAVL